MELLKVTAHRIAAENPSKWNEINLSYVVNRNLSHNQRRKVKRVVIFIISRANIELLVWKFFHTRGNFEGSVTKTFFQQQTALTLPQTFGGPFIRETKHRCSFLWAIMLPEIFHNA